MYASAQAGPITLEGNERIQLTFRLDNKTDTDVSTCRLTAAPLAEGGQIGKAFDLKAGETKIITYTAPSGSALTVQPGFTPLAGGMRQTIRMDQIETA